MEVQPVSLRHRSPDATTELPKAILTHVEGVGACLSDGVGSSEKRFMSTPCRVGSSTTSRPEVGKRTQIEWGKGDPRYEFQGVY